MQAAASDSLIGFTLTNKYKVLRQIGRGGMGVVYEAEHVELGKRVAIKLMLEKYAEDNEAITRFKREAFAASQIGNPHIIDVSDIGTAPDGRSYVVMELLNGSPLSRVLEAGPMSPTRAIGIMRQVLRAVGAAHAKGIIHRDLKPDNIFLTDRGDGSDFVKLLDFGISKIVDLDAEVASTRLTSTGMVMGTPLYMAPEQAMGSPIDHHCDIYACGVILYEMLAGKPPFEGATYAVLVAKLLTATPPLLSEVRPGLPHALVVATARALEKEPEARFDSADKFAASLPGDRSPSMVELAQTMDSGMVAVAMPPKQASKRGLIVAIAAVVVVAAIVVVIATRPSSPASAVAAVGSAAVAPAVGSAAGPAAVVAVGSAAVAPVKPPTTGKLFVKSLPDHATVSIDRQVVGTAPIELTIPVGKHHVRVDLAGFASIDEDDDVLADERNSVTIALPKAAPVTAIHHNNPPPLGKPPGLGSATPPIGPAIVQPPVKPPEVPVKPPETPKPPHDPHSTSAKPNPYQ